MQSSRGTSASPGAGRLNPDRSCSIVRGRQRRTHNEEPWVLSLEGTTPGGEDELSALRARGQAVEALGVGPPGVGAPPPGVAQLEEESSQKGSKKVKKKKK